MTVCGWTLGNSAVANIEIDKAVVGGDEQPGNGARCIP